MTPPCSITFSVIHRANRGRVDGTLVTLDRIQDQDVFWSVLRQQDRNVRFVADSSTGDRVQSMYEQPYMINEFAGTAAALAGRFAKLSEQVAERGEFHPPVPFFQVYSRGRGTSRALQVPEDRVGAFGFALVRCGSTMWWMLPEMGLAYSLL
jgi:hypothetical protein